MTQVVAIFDVDGTLVRSNALTYYLFYLRHLSSPARRAAAYLGLPYLAPYWLALDRVDRGRFNRSFYRHYRGFSVVRATNLAEDCFRAVMMPRMIPEALQRAAEHRARGDRILLVSGSPDFILTPLAAHLGAEALLSTRLADSDGRYTGEIDGPNMAGEVKAATVAAYARAHGIDLSRSHAYADSFSDVPVLRLVGHPVVINPDRHLRRVARASGWEQLAPAK